MVKNKLTEGEYLIVLGPFVIVHSDHEQTIVKRYTGYWTSIEQIIIR